MKEDWQKLNINFEKAVRMMVEAFPPSEEGARKPVLFHDIRVGTYLYENNYSSDIVLAGLLHDALEWSGMDEEKIKEEFGGRVLEIVKANSKDRTIADSDERIDENVRRCAKAGEDALIVKAADILDSQKHYTMTKNEKELGYCRKTMEAIKKHKPGNFQDNIFNLIA